jgi:hypothetical protein
VHTYKPREATVSDFRSLLQLTSASAATAVYAIDLFKDNLNESELALKLERNMRSTIWMLGDLARDYLLPKGVEQMKVKPGTDALKWPWVDGFRNDIKKVRDLYEPLSHFKGQAPLWPTIAGTLTVLMKFEKDFKDLEELLEWVMKMQEEAGMSPHSPCV